MLPLPTAEGVGVKGEAESHAARAGLGIAVGPQSASWVEDAIRRGGGEPVDLARSPRGLIWMDGLAVEGLRALLEHQPSISWVQLPMAGVEAMMAAGLVDRDRQWTSAKGAFAEPVAEHACTMPFMGPGPWCWRSLSRPTAVA